ncbi:MAG: hypothetical protein QNJ78_06405 [Gammaproteobacteria bacterium]|nr:hypothetical protein [Gammaproteobacteria bacterium]
MPEIAELLKQRFQDRLAGEMESVYLEEIEQHVYWKPLTGAQQKIIQKAGKNSEVSGVCQHVKTRALDKDGKPIFQDIALVGMENDFDYDVISKIFLAMNGLSSTVEDIEKN